jgi:1,1a-dihydroxy-1-hydro-9-fluorenone dehydrogenase
MMLSHGEVEGRVVVVTGAARGMGRAYVEGFLAANACVVATDKSWTGVEDFRGDLAEKDSALALDMDVTSDAEIERAYQATLAKFGTVDVLINNAGLIFLVDRAGRFTTLETTDQDWLNSFGVNVFGTLKVTRRFIKPMIEKGKGSVINIVSNGILASSHGGGYVALRPWSREMPYMASKAALATMSFYLADEVRPHNVAVNTIIPGHARGSWFDDNMRARLAEGRPGGGPRPVRPEHIVPLALFLAVQDGGGTSGKMFDALQWNEEHGFGGYEEWKDMSFPPDLEAAFAAQGERPPTLPWSYGPQRRI